jgi:hypothetical protein
LRLKERISDLQRSANQGSQELQGESLELTLKSAIQRVCPLDILDDVPRGRTGADIHQQVRDGAGNGCGLILWEAKDARAWTDTWVDRLKDAQRQADAELAVVVSRALPRSLQSVDPRAGSFALYRDIWVVTPSAAPALAVVLRHLLHRVSHERILRKGQDARMEALHTFLQSNSFRLQVVAVIDAVRGMLADLDSEQRSFHRAWQRRRQRIESLSTCVSQILGGLEGATGRALPDAELSDDEVQPEGSSDSEEPEGSDSISAFLVLDELGNSNSRI